MLLPNVPHVARSALIFLESIKNVMLENEEVESMYPRGNGCMRKSTVPLLAYMPTGRVLFYDTVGWKTAGHYQATIDKLLKGERIIPPDIVCANALDVTPASLIVVCYRKGMQEDMKEETEKAIEYLKQKNCNYAVLMTHDDLLVADSAGLSVSSDRLIKVTNYLPDEKLTETKNVQLLKAFCKILELAESGASRSNSNSNCGSLLLVLFVLVLALLCGFLLPVIKLNKANN